MVKRGSSQQLDYEILFPGCVLRSVQCQESRLTKLLPESQWIPFHSPLCRWQFATESADIGFGVFLKDRKGEWRKAAQMQEVVPSQRYNAHLVPEDGSLTCEQPGVCKWAAAPITPTCWSLVLILHLVFTQMFWDSTTLTVSSKLKESASPLKCCCLTTCLLRGTVEGFKKHAQAEDGSQSEAWWHHVSDLLLLLSTVYETWFIYMLVNVASLM